MWDEDENLLWSIRYIVIRYGTLSSKEFMVCIGALRLILSPPEHFYSLLT